MSHRKNPIPTPVGTGPAPGQRNSQYFPSVSMPVRTPLPADLDSSRYASI